MKTDIWPVLIRRIFYPLWMMYDGDKGALQYLNYFHYIDTLNRSELLASQNHKLKNILIHAYENTAYYKRVFDEVTFSPYKMRENSEIQKIPFLTKAIVKKYHNELIAQNISPHLRTEASTGGSTGVPMYFLRDKECVYLRRGQELYFDRWMGYKLGEKIGYFVAGSHYDGKISHIKGKIRNAICERIVNFDPHDISETYMKTFAARYQRYKPKMIKCFPNALIPFAHFVNRSHLSIPPVRSISCTGENLYMQQRRLFQEVFGGEVYEKVGTRESGVIACECSLHKGLHLFTEGVFAEIIKENGEPAKAGEMGRLIITDLFNKAMPLIRYEIGDMAVASDNRICKCGSELPLIEKYLGRDRDIIFDSYGNPKPGYLFVEVIKHLNLDAQLQVIQPDKHSLLVKVVKNSIGEIDLEELKSEYQKIVGPRFTITFDFTDEVKRDSSGKFSYVKSEIKQ